jgi:hypothetical protein
MREGLAKAKVSVKPCPFCGNFPTMEPWHGGGPKKRMIHCEAEECEVSPSVCAETPTAAARRWNGRSAATNPRQIEG